MMMHWNSPRKPSQAAYLQLAPGQMSSEETAQNTYAQESKENEIEKTTKKQDGKYKTKESIGLDKSKMTSLPTRRMLRSSFAQLPSASRRLRTSALPSRRPTRTGWLVVRQK